MVLLPRARGRGGQDGSGRPALSRSQARGYPYLDTCLAVVTLDDGLLRIRGG